MIEWKWWMVHWSWSIKSSDFWWEGKLLSNSRDGIWFPHEARTSSSNDALARADEDGVFDQRIIVILDYWWYIYSRSKYCFSYHRYYRISTGIIAWEDCIRILCKYKYLGKNFLTLSLIFLYSIICLLESAPLLWRLPLLMDRLFAIKKSKATSPKNGEVFYSFRICTSQVSSQRKSSSMKSTLFSYEFIFLNLYCFYTTAFLQENLPPFSLPEIEDGEYSASSPKELFETDWAEVVAGFVGKTEAIVVRVLWK